MALLLSMGYEPGGRGNQRILFAFSSFQKWQNQISCAELAA